MKARIAMTERLEGRVLMSAFSTVDTFELSAGHSAWTQTMAADAGGDVFAVGNANTAANLQVGIVREKAAGSSTWNTIDAFSYVAGKSTTFSGAAVGPDGALYISGGGADGTGRGHWLTLKSANGGLSIIDDFVTSGGAAANKMAVDASGNLYVAGGADYVKGNSTTFDWVVRRRLAGQTSFTTVDNLTSTGSGAGAIGVTTVAAGPAAGVYVVGSASAANGSGNWIVRKSADAGTTWATIDNFQLTPNTGSNMAEAVTGDGAGNVFVAGLGSAPSNLMSHWIVRKSGDGGATWTTSDNFRLASTKNAVASGAGVDASGNVYVAGYGIDSNNVRHAVLRTNTGGTWAIADDFQSGAAAGYRAFTADAAGNLYVAGTGDDASGVGESIVRSSSPPTLGPSPSVFSSTPLSPANASLDIVQKHRPHHLLGVPR